MLALAFGLVLSCSISWGMSQSRPSCSSSRPLTSSGGGLGSESVSRLISDHSRTFQDLLHYTKGREYFIDECLKNIVSFY